jgi:CheY-like chemotaxis protein
MGSYTVLLVEDERSLRQILATTLRAAGYEVVEAHDGLQAIQILEELILTTDQPDVILLDMMMPRLDGLGVIHHLTDHGYRTPVIALSTSEWCLFTAKSAGACAAIPKPFDLNKVLDVVECFCTTVD